VFGVVQINNNEVIGGCEVPYNCLCTLIYIVNNNLNMEYKFKIKAVIIFERITEKAFSISTNEDLYTYFYAIRMANIDKYNETFEEFLDWCDNNPDELNDFVKQMEQHNKRQSNLSKEKGTAEGN
jgi:hypothetical protein